MLREAAVHLSGREVWAGGLQPSEALDCGTGSTVRSLRAQGRQVCARGAGGILRCGHAGEQPHAPTGCVPSAQGTCV